MKRLILAATAAGFIVLPLHAVAEAAGSDRVVRHSSGGTIVQRAGRYVAGTYRHPAVAIAVREGARSWRGGPMAMALSAAMATAMYFEAPELLGLGD